jgi:hypothetical protein
MIIMLKSILIFISLTQILINFHFFLVGLYIFLCFINEYFMLFMILVTHSFHLINHFYAIVILFDW